MLTRCLAAMLGLLLLPVLASAQPRVRVWVEAERTNGFVEPGIVDSVRDLQREIRQRRIKSLSLALTPTDADLLFTVTVRDTSAGGAIAMTLPGHVSTTATVIGSTVFADSVVSPPSTFSIPVTWKFVGGWVTAVRRWPDEPTPEDFTKWYAAKELGHAVTGSTNGAWRGAAKDVAVRLDAWVEANQAAIAALTR